MKKLLFVLPMIACMASSGARANWEYDGVYVRDGHYEDDGRRFIILVRGGMSYGMGKMKNDISTLTSEFYYDPNDGAIVSAAYYETCTTCGDYVYAGVADIGKLPIKEDYGEIAFTGGAAIGWVLPWTPHWRFQVDWDYVSEAEYNASPMLEGSVPLTGGDVDGLKVDIRSGGVQSTVTTNVFTAMAIRDFYDGWEKPMRKFIPYAGFGLGYADSDTVLTLSDLYGDLSSSVDLQNYGKADDYGVLQFYSAKKSSSNLAGILTFGISYGVSESFFLDSGFRFIYVPKVKWALGTADNSRTRDWFHSENMLFTNFVFGFRWEF